MSRLRSRFFHERAGPHDDYVVLGRALIADPDLIERMQRGDVSRTRCNACNECVAEMDIAGVRCTLDP